MKIVFLVAHLQSGGAERTVSYLSSFLAEQGKNVKIISLTDDIFYEINPKVQIKSLRINTQPTNPISKILLAAKRTAKINQTVIQEKPDVVFCMLPDMAKYILPLHRLCKFKLITSERINPESNSPKVRKLKLKIYSQSNGIIFQTLRAKNFYPEAIRENGVVIHNAIGNEYVYTCPEPDNRKKKISAIGRLADQKDYPLLLRSFSNVTKKYPEFSLEIFGSGPDLDKLKKLCNELNISDKVIFMGSHKDAIVKASDSTCYVMSSKFEGMPNALLEAMAVGLPCISTDCPNGPAELITSGENGVLVPVGDEKALTDAILNFIENPDFANMCGRNAKKILETHNIYIKAREYMDYIIKIFNEE